MSDVNAIEALARRFPDRARKIRRLQAEDATFRAICDDYAEALRALEHWQGTGESAQQRIEEYRQMVTEIENEALGVIKAQAASGT